MAKRGSSSLDATLSETDKASNETRNNKRMKQDTISTNGVEDEWSRISPATPSYPRSSQRWPNLDAHSVALRDSTLTGVPTMCALDSTDQSIIAKVHNAVNGLQNIALIKDEIMDPMIILNESKDANHSRPIPTNSRGNGHKWRCISSATPLFFPTGSQMPPNLDAHSVALRNSTLIGVPPLDALNSTELSPMVRIDNELRNMAQAKSAAVAPNDNRGGHQYRSLPTNGRTHHGRSIDVSLQSLNREKDGGANQPHDISVPLFTKPRSQAVQKPSTSNDAAIVFWMDELKRYWCNIEDQTKSALELMKQDLIQKGLLFDEKFKERFLDSAYEKILRAFEQFLLDERCFNKFFGTTFANTDTDQPNRILQANLSIGEDIHDIELDDSLVCHQVPPVMLPDVHRNSFEETVDEILVQICNDDPEQRHQVEDQQVMGEKVLKAEIPETIDLVSDQEEAVNHGGNDDNQNVANIASPSEPTAQQQKKKNKNASTKRNLKKMSRLNEADTEKRHECDFCEYSTDKKSSLTSHIRTHTNERPYECNICEKRFTQKSALNTHMKTHREMFAFHCLNCRLGFPNEKQQKLHEKRCKAKGYECHLCKRVLTGKRHLVEHMRAHTGEKLRCSKCRKQFSSNNGLTHHMKAHGKQFRFQCSYCRQGFSHKTAWKSHESRCKLRQYECFLCNKKFGLLKGNLLKHMRHKHTGDQPFGCSDCSERFFTKLGLARHTKRCHLKGK